MQRWAVGGPPSSPGLVAARRFVAGPTPERLTGSSRYPQVCRVSAGARGQQARVRRLQLGCARHAGRRCHERETDASAKTIARKTRSMRKQIGCWPAARWATTAATQQREMFGTITIFVDGSEFEHMASAWGVVVVEGAQAGECRGGSALDALDGQWRWILRILLERRCLTPQQLSFLQSVTGCVAR